MKPTRSMKSTQPRQRRQSKPLTKRKRAGPSGGALGLKIAPVTPSRWKDFETLFGERGACGGCWCMWWKLTRSQFEKNKGTGNKRAMKELIASGEVPGLLAYSKGRPVAWCAVAPREEYPALERSRILKRVDDKPVWSVVCFFIDKGFRRQGVSIELLRAAVGYAEKRGAKTVEGYPVEPKTKDYAAAFAYTGLASAFRKVGFVEVLRRSETRPIMRYYV
jgi:GNAT superfamily N-acetyltransferase